MKNFDRLFQDITDFISEVDPEIYVVDVSLKKGRQSLLSVKVDTDDGISLAKCERVSRKLGNWLDETEIINFSYRLEVSSPGIGYPLKIRRQYIRNVNKYLRIILEDNRQVEGKLLSVEENGIFIAASISGKTKTKKKIPDTEETGTFISFSEIVESKVIVHF